MSVAEHELMHGDHRFWESEISQWRDDLRVWQHELAKAQADQELLTKSLEGHALRLRTHASSLRLEEIAFDGHEHEIVEREKRGEGEVLATKAQEHQQESARHITHRTAHEMLKRKHHHVMAYWNLLCKALQESVEE